MKPPFESLLIANRGEIARRIQHACRELGVRSVAVYSDVDAQAPFVREADAAVALEGASAAETYLNVEKILAAAARSGARAVHPGYGFLSENEAFARAVIEAGLIWVGPPPEAIAAMGTKAQARTLAVKAGVPVVPGVTEDGHGDAQLLKEAQRLGWPVLLKASAGGGGKGMRAVSAEEDFAAALAATRREAQSAFGNAQLILEKYVQNPRHIEVQVFGDAHGNVVHLFERECSIQRRHQKVLEESPSPALTDEARTAITQAAVALAQAVGYAGAGTVEFILDEDGTFYFLEMNTRLQVEHPVTEWVTGLDLVALQLRVAAGDPLPFAQADIALRGHAIEARLYAEDPAFQFAPQTGTIEVLCLAGGPGVRWDVGVEPGSVVSAHYDPMLGKLIVHGTDRPAARQRLLCALRETVVLGLVTNLDFLQAVVAHPAFAAGQTTTGFIAEHFGNWRAPEPDAQAWAALAAFETWGRTRAVAAGQDPRAFDPWDLDARWRNA